jgi:hypothetical protein
MEAYFIAATMSSISKQTTRARDGECVKARSQPNNPAGHWMFQVRNHNERNEKKETSVLVAINF